MKLIINSFSCRNIGDLTDNFNIVEVLDNFLNGNLEIWLEEIEADEFFKVKKIDKSEDYLMISKQLCDIFWSSLTQSDIVKIKEFKDLKNLEELKELELNFLKALKLAFFQNEQSYLKLVTQNILKSSISNEFVIKVFGKTSLINQNIENYKNYISSLTKKSLKEFLDFQINQLESLDLEAYLLSLNDYTNLDSLKEFIKNLSDNEKSSFNPDVQNSSTLAQQALLALALGTGAVLAGLAIKNVFDGYDIDESFDKITQEVDQFFSEIDGILS